jgi:radical SAM protein with 4Fe4S-binding SPASM domain
MATIFIGFIQVIQSFTIKRLANFICIYSSYWLTRVLGKPIHWGNPVSVSIEPTTSCNLRCPECPSGLRSFSRPTGMLSLKSFQSFIDKIKGTTPFLTLYFQGEPYLNPDFFQMIEYAVQQKMIVTTSTNGHYLNEENALKTIESGLQRLIVSIDGTTQETYGEYRIGGSLETVWAGIKKLVEVKNQLKSHTPKIIVQFLVVKPNEHQVDEIKAIAKKEGVDEVKIKTAQLYDYENGNPLMPENPKYSRYIKTKNGKYKLRNKLKNHCFRHWMTSVITWDGNVLPCCFDKDGENALGSLSVNDFQNVIKSDRAQSFRKQLSKSRKSIDICSNCTEGTKIWA